MLLSEMLQALDLQVEQDVLDSLERLADELLRWNCRRNLTAITARDEVLEKHLADSLTLLPLARRSSHLLDIGSGAGFPSLPLKLACPRLEVVSVDAVGKKVDFQRHMSRILALRGFTAVHDRIETLHEGKKYQRSFDLITARALCSLEELLALGEPLLAPGGCLVAMKGPEGGQELNAMQELLREAGWRPVLHCLRLPLSGAERCLVELSR